MHKIKFIIPVMRNESALLVLEDLSKQTKKVDCVTIIDNGGKFVVDPEKYPFQITLIKPFENIGTNAAWNYIFSRYNYDKYIGILGDDFRFGPHLVDILIKTLHKKENIGAATATIFNKRKVSEADPNIIEPREVKGKGHMGAVIFRPGILDRIPKIPKELFIFFGDNWIGHWLKEIDMPLHETSVGIEHHHKTDLKEKLNYKGYIKTERKIWRQWTSGEIKLGGIEFK